MKQRLSLILIWFAVIWMILIARGQRPRSPQVRADQDVAELAGGVEHRA